MDSKIQRFVASHAVPVTTGAAAVFTLFALGPSPSFIPLIITVGILRLCSRLIAQQEHTVTFTLGLWLALTAGTCITFIQPSLSALSSSASTVAYLFLLSSLTSALALVPIFADTNLRTRLPSNLIFPALWSATWCIVSHSSPLGRVVTWSPIHGVDTYLWLRPYVGPVGIDWVVGAWAVIVSDIASLWAADKRENKAKVGQLISVDSLDEASQEQYVSREAPQRSITHVGKLVLFLGLLTIPGFSSSSLPLPVHSDNTHEIKVACALPIVKDGIPTLHDYMKETSKLMPGAQIIVWPESAVRFSSTKEKQAAFMEMRKSLQGNKLLVAGFDGYSDSPSTSRQGKFDNGVVMMTNESGIVMEYHKRHLVPIVEPYSIIQSSEPPTTYDYSIQTNKHSYTTIPLTTSICMDFGHPSPFSGLSTRPALILAPAKTWHPDIGLAMFSQAQARAAEVGSTILWCDGGAGGVSGLDSDIVQVGLGSWTKSIGISKSFDYDPSSSDEHRAERMTTYASLGDWEVLALVLAFSGVGAFGVWDSGIKLIGHATGSARVLESVRWVGANSKRLLGAVRSWRTVQRVDVEQPPEQRPLLE